MNIDELEKVLATRDKTIQANTSVVSLSNYKPSVVSDWLQSNCEHDYDILYTSTSIRIRFQSNRDCLVFNLSFNLGSGQ